MKSFLFIYSAVSVGVFAHALPHLEARYDVPSVGENCDYQGVCAVRILQALKAE
jgi:hypothetical protein